MLRRRIRKSFSDLVQENKQALLKDNEAMERLEEKLDQKHMHQA